MDHRDAAICLNLVVLIFPGQLGIIPKGAPATQGVDTWDLLCYFGEAMTNAITKQRSGEPGLVDCLIAHTLVNLCFTTDAREPLEAHGFGRVHHRILFFVTQRPGITVNELIAVMRVSHQNLRGPMRQLIEHGYLVSQAAAEDRRHKRTYVSVSGMDLIERLSSAQLKRIQRAFTAAGPEAVKAFFQVHRLLMDSADVQWMEQAAELRGAQKQARKKVAA